MQQLGTLSALEEHRFWLGNLEDHAYFLLDALSPLERQWSDWTLHYIRALAALRTETERLPDGLEAGDAAMTGFARKAQPVVHGFYLLCGKLLSMRLDNEIHLGLNLSDLNRCLIEEEEYLRLLPGYVRGEKLDARPIGAVIENGLENQLGNAILLAQSLDPAETALRAQAEKFPPLFSGLLARCRQLRYYMRFRQEDSPIIKRLAAEIHAAVASFAHFVGNVLELHAQKILLTRATERMLLHHFPETRYFLVKLYDALPRSWFSEEGPGDRREESQDEQENRAEKQADSNDRKTRFESRRKH